MKYDIIITSAFKKQLKSIKKRNKPLDKLTEVVNKLANNETLDEKYRDHQLVNTERFKDCRECHIEPDWLLIYQIKDKELILLIFSIGSHSELFK